MGAKVIEGAGSPKELHRMWGGEKRLAGYTSLGTFEGTLSRKASRRKRPR